MCDSFHISHFSCLLISCYLFMYSPLHSVYYPTYAKKQWWISVIVTVKITKNRYTAIKFIDFLRFPLSIDQNHLIATDFYRHRSLSIDYCVYAQ